MPDLPWSILMVLVSAFYACFAYSRLGMIWKPKIPKGLCFAMIAIIYGALNYIGVYYLQFRYMLLIFMIVNLAVVKLVFNTGPLMTLFCANIYVYVYSISQIIVSSIADIIFRKHIHTFGDEINTAHLSIMLIFIYLISAAFMYVFTMCASHPIVQEQYKSNAPGLVSTIKKFTILLIVFYFIELSSELIPPLTPATSAFYHLALSLLLAVSFFLMFVYFSAIDRITENSEQTKKELHERRFAYYNGQAKYLDEFRQFRHDYKNRLAGLKALLDNGDTEKAKEYLADISEKFDIMREHTKTYSNNTLIDSILQNLSVRCGTDIEFDAAVIVGDELPLPDIDICTIFYNIADNAYEAASKEYEGKKFINFITSRREKWLIVTAENSFDGLLITGKDNELETIKNDDISHGIGLKNVKRIVEAVPGAMVKIEPDMDERIFRISLIFPR